MELYSCHNIFCKYLPKDFIFNNKGVPDVACYDCPSLIDHSKKEDEENKEDI